jgi:septum formation protein
MEIILGSNSPRRREILNFFSLPFRQIASDFDEAQLPFRGDAAAYARQMAERKASALRERFPTDVILTADTVVSLPGRIFNKPESLQEAHAMLSELSGKEHSVFTGVCVAAGPEQFSEAEMSLVEFHQLSDSQIRAYHRHFSPLDKAGAYAIQKAGSLIVKRIEGCYYNIMGLPLQTVHRLLLKAGIDLWDYLKSV